MLPIAGKSISAILGLKNFPAGGKPLDPLT